MLKLQMMEYHSKSPLYRYVNIKMFWEFPSARIGITDLWSLKQPYSQLYHNMEDIYDIGT